MKEIVEKTLKIYREKMREPKADEVISEDTSLEDQKWNCFVTIYVDGEVRGSSGNIKEIETSLKDELIQNTVWALKNDKRFSPLKRDELEKLQFRVDLITNREIVDIKTLKTLDPVKKWVIAIKRDYEKLAVILPNMSAKLLTGADFIAVLQNKLSEKKVDDTGYILYSIETQVETNY